MARPSSPASRNLVQAYPMNTVSTPTQASVDGIAIPLLPLNFKRRSFMVQNTGTTIIYLSLGTVNPTTSAYHVALKACSSANDGTGGAYVDDAWTGQVNAIGSTGGGTVVVTEIQE